LYIGIEKKAARPIEALTSKLAKNTGHGGSPNDYWVWGRWVDDSYRNWNTPETLERLSEATERERALSYFVDYLELLKNEGEGDIGQTVRNSP